MNLLYNISKALTFMCFWIGLITILEAVSNREYDKLLFLGILIINIYCVSGSKSKK